VRSVARAQLVVDNTLDAPSSKAFLSIADRLLESIAEGMKVKGNLQFFFQRMLQGARGDT
jgi:hypothetical protein